MRNKSKNIILFYYLKEDNTIDLSQALKHVLIIEVKNVLERQKIEYLIKTLDSIKNISYNPMVLFLFDEFEHSNNNNSLNIEWKKYSYIDPRTIFTGPFISKKTVNYIQIYESTIQKILYRFCSIHNELGDRFTIGQDKNQEDIDLIEKYFPFNINIACIGRFRQGKSTGVNAILNCYEAKESNFGTSQTKKLNFYQVKNKPIRVLDIPGFENEKTVNDAIEKFKLCGDVINRIKDKIHIVLYFLNYKSDEIFYEFELPMMKEIVNHKDSQVIYVITHSDEEDMEKEDKNEYIKKINVRLGVISKKYEEQLKSEQMAKILSINPENVPIQIYDEENCKKEAKELTEKMNANLENVIFVNFHETIISKKIKIPEFGKKELFTAIKNHFIKTSDYKSSCEELSQEKINENAEKLKARAKDAVLANKIWGGVIGVIPGIDWLVQRFAIKKNALKKIAQTFGMDIKLIEETEEKNKKKEDEKSKNTIIENSINIIESKNDVKEFELKDNKINKGNEEKAEIKNNPYTSGGVSDVIEAVRIGATQTLVVGLEVIGRGLLVFGSFVGVLQVLIL